MPVSVPEQPTLRDGDVVLRPWTDADVDTTRPGHDAEMARRFGFPTILPTPEQQRSAVARWHQAYADGRHRVAFLVEHVGEPAGVVEVRQVGDGRGELSWALYAGHRRRGIAIRAVGLLIRYAFHELRLVRLEAYVEPDNLPSLRLASRAGLRREGMLRQRETIGDQRRDLVMLARLVDDPEPQSRDGFISVLNAALPTKRVIAQGMLRDAAGRLLLCELTYKLEWDLPGGVVEPGESPAQGVVREVREELGLDVGVHRLVTVNWLPPWRSWDDACVFVFDLGVLEDPATIRLDPAEIVAVHWCDLDDITARAAPATETLLRYVAAHPRGLPYLEIGAEPPLLA